MNSAAVIGRQLRQQNTGRASGPLAPSGRPRAPSHINLGPVPSPGTLGPGGTSTGQAAAPNKKDEKESGLASVKNKISLQCIWDALKALSGGMFLIIVGTAMCVVGFYAETLSTSEVRDGNQTLTVIDRSREQHLHNLSFVGPAVMGLGGILIVAACVLTFEVKEHHARVVPVDERRPSATEALISDPLGGPSARTAFETTGPYLTVPQVSTVWTSESSSNPGPANPGPSYIETSPPQPPRSLIIPNGPHRTYRPKPPRKPPSLSSSSTCTNFLLSPQYEDHFLPSPQDVQIPDPDGCDTPGQDSLASMHLELYLSKCPVTVRVQVQPKLFASMESDGLSDSDEGSDICLRDFAMPSGRFGAHSSSMDQSTLDLDEQVMPLLGRCSPPDLVVENEVPLLRRDGPKRFPLLRQPATDGSRGLNGKAEEISS